MRVICAGAGALLGLALAVGISPAASEKDIDLAIKRGADYLRGAYKQVGLEQTQSPEGIGPVALSGLAMLEANVPGTDPAIVGILAAVRDQSYREYRTYQLTLCLLFLDRYADPADEGLMQVLGVRLLAGQNSLGGWTYDSIDVVNKEDEQRLRTALKTPAPAPAKDGKPATPRMHPDVEKYAVALMANRTTRLGDDNSNTQFGVLALWVARRHNVPVDAGLDALERRFLGSQSQAGGWGYTGPGAAISTDSPAMTCAGLLGLATGVARREERRMKAEAKREPPAKDGDAPPPPKKTGKPKPIGDDRDVAVQRGLALLGTYLGNSVRAGRGALVLPNDDKSLYFLWSLERVCVIYGIEKLGGVDWYEVGADLLVRAQANNGSWNAGHGPEVSTSFALLFLTKANVARDLSNKVQRNPSNNELRAGTGGSDTKPGPGTGTGAEVPPKNPGTPPKPGPVEDESGRLAAELVLKSSATDWADALAKVRDAKGGDYTKALVAAIPKLDGDKKKQARDALAERLTRMTADTLRAMMKAEDPELRRAAVLAAAMKDDKDHVPDLIDRITDNDDLVVRAAKAGLKSLTSQDFGPAADATKEQKKAAADAWKKWWATPKK